MSASLSRLALALALTTALSSAELLQVTDFSVAKDEILKVWKGLPEDLPGVSQASENGKTFLRLTSTAPGSTVLRQDVVFPVGTKTLTLVAKMRATGVARGEFRWHVPRIAILWTNDPEKVKQFTLNLTKDEPWKEHRFTIPVPPESDGFRIYIGTPKGTGVMDIASISLLAE